MLQLKTHYEQVPLKVVRKILEEQIRLERAIEEDRGTSKKKIERSSDFGPAIIRGQLRHIFSGGV